MSTQGFNIAAVERDTGLSKDLLRMWERRYGFPAPERDQHGERVYSVLDLERLRRIKRLIDKGFRPGKILKLASEELEQLLQDVAPTVQADAQMNWEPYLEHLRQGDLPGLRNALQQQLLLQGLQSFVLDIVAPLTVAVGEAWMRGSIRVHEEHAYSEIIKALLQQAISLFSERGSPTLLLTTLPDEQHGLGLLMAEALFVIAGARCVSLGTRTPMLEIVDAAARHHVDCVALSFSTSFPARQGTQQIRELRELLPEKVEIWVGGGGSSVMQLPPGVYRAFPTTPGEAVMDWHRRNGRGVAD
ncbi:MAG: MerR family transcriptional regulator [Rhodocyclaceae bacterium]|nr:MerR family transcriptional regulator [Rhodocyclaceae bacterium]